MLLVMAGTAITAWICLPELFTRTQDTAATFAAPAQPDPPERVFRGFVTDGGRTYYFDDNGFPLRNGIVGSDAEGYAPADENGVCCMSEEMRLAAQFMMQCCEGDTLEEKMKTGFLYLARRIPYLRSYDHELTAQDMAALAVEMFTKKKGNCYRYAACFACIAKIAGYRARVVMGSTAGNPHGWVEVLVGRQWLICDPDTQMAEPLLADYDAYMMKKHVWQVTAKQRFELTITEDGAAVWTDVTK